MIIKIPATIESNLVCLNCSKKEIYPNITLLSGYITILPKFKIGFCEIQ